MGARSSYSKELHTRLAEDTLLEVAVEEVISNSDDKLTRLEVAVEEVISNSDDKHTRLEVVVGAVT